jgi:predicted transglutaminase-like cysteine proteinase
MLNRPIPSNSITLSLSAVISVFCLMVFCVTGALAQNENDIDEPFGLSTVATPETVLAAMWENLLREINSDLSIIARCRIEPQSCSSPAEPKFVGIAKEGEQHEPLAQIGHINRAANFAMRVLDTAHADDEWRSPLAALSRTAGDCKHFAVLKYAALREAGFAPEVLKIVIVEVRSTHQQHALLAVRADKGRWLLLDNHTLTLVESSLALDHYDPLYEFAQDGVRQFALPSRPPQIANSFQRPPAR